MSWKTGDAAFVLYGLYRKKRQKQRPPVLKKRQKQRPPVLTSPCLSDWIAIDVEKNTHIFFYCYGKKAAYASLNRRFIAYGGFGYYY